MLQAENGVDFGGGCVFEHCFIWWLLSNLLRGLAAAVVAVIAIDP